MTQQQLRNNFVSGSTEKEYIDKHIKELKGILYNIDQFIKKNKLDKYNPAADPVSFEIFITRKFIIHIMALICKEYEPFCSFTYKTPEAWAKVLSYDISFKEEPVKKQNALEYSFSLFSELINGNHHPRFYYNDVYDDSKNTIPANNDEYFNGFITESDRAVLDVYKTDFNVKTQLEEYKHNDWGIHLDDYTDNEYNLLKYLHISAHITQHRINQFSEVYTKEQINNIVIEMPKHVKYLLDDIENYEYNSTSNPEKSVFLILQYARVMLMNISLYAREQYPLRLPNREELSIADYHKEFNRDTIRLLINGRIRYIDFFSSHSKQDLLLILQHSDILSFDPYSIKKNHEQTKKIDNPFDYLLYCILIVDNRFSESTHPQVGITNSAKEIIQHNKECCIALSHLKTNSHFLPIVNNVDHSIRKRFIDEEIQFINSLNSPPVNDTLYNSFEQRYSIELNNNIYIYFNQFKVNKYPTLSSHNISDVVTGGALFSYYLYLVEIANKISVVEPATIKLRKPEKKQKQSSNIPDIKSFYYKNIDKDPEALNNFFDSLVKNEFIPDKKQFKQFKAAFSGSMPKNKIIWKGKISDLAYLIKEICKIKVLIPHGQSKFFCASKVFSVIGNENYPYTKMHNLKVPKSSKEKLDKAISHLS